MNDPRKLDHLVIATGPNVRLRHRIAEDGPNEFRWRSDPESARYNGAAANQEPFERFLDAFAFELQNGRSDREQYAIETLDGEHIGTVMLYNFSRGNEGAELGITIGEESVRGRGLGREAVTLLLRWAWQNRSIRGVYLHALEWNERAMRCFRAAGFGDVARVIRDGQALVRMEVRREWWLLWEMEGRFELGARVVDTVDESEREEATA